MDESNETFTACFTLSNLLRSADLSARETNWKRQVQSFMANKLTNCAMLYHELKDGSYKMSRSDHFTIVERGKTRVVKTINIRDRVVQRCLCDHILVPAIRRNVIDGNAACLKGRGLHYCLERLRQDVNVSPWTAYYLQFDFHDYFHCINKVKLLNQLAKIIKDPEVLGLISLIINDDEDGLELGSHVSQVCATYYPDEMDRDILSKSLGYERYMDDGIAVCAGKEEAEHLLETLNRWTRELDLTLNAKKTVINRISHPIVFCKTRFRKYQGGVRMTVRKPQTRRSIKHLRAVKKLYESGKTDSFENSIAGCSGYINHGDADLTRLLLPYY